VCVVVGGVERLAASCARRSVARLELILQHSIARGRGMRDAPCFGLFLFLVLPRRQPHGATPSPGLWRFAGRIGAYLLIASIVLSAFGRGKWRLFILGWAASLALVSYAILMLDMDWTGPSSAAAKLSVRFEW
jgi:hypothetical protein